MKTFRSLRPRPNKPLKRRAMSLTSLNRRLIPNVSSRNLSIVEDLVLNPQSSSIGNADLFQGGLQAVSNPLLDQAVLDGVSDGRFYHPNPVNVAPSIQSGANRLGVRNDWRMGDIGFSRPSGVLTCIRRRIRKNVLFALGVAGQRGRKKKPRWNRYSYVRC